LRESERKYRTFFENTGAGYAIGELRRDASGKATDWRYIDFNAALARHTGMDRATSTGRWFSELFPSADQTYWLDIFQSVVDTQTVRTFEDYWPPIDRWLGGVASPAPDGRYYIVFQDVSERKRAELALQESESAACRAEQELRALNATLAERIEEHSATLRLYRDIVQSDDAPVVAFDTDMRITAFNKAHAEAYLRVYGIEQKVGDSLLEQFVPEQVEKVRGFMARALAGESFIMRESFGDPDLEVPNWQIAYNPLRDDHGRIIGGFHHALDVTAEVTARLELERTQDVLRQSQKMEAIGQLTGGIAHDFNNLLTVIRGSVDLLRRDNVSSDKRQRYLDAIGDTADRASKLTGQLLAFARRQTLAPEVFDVAERLGAIADMLDSITGARVLVRFEVPEAACRIRADVSQFETALVNLAVNARDAMNGEGTVTIRLSCNAKMPAIRGHGPGSGDFVAVSITDTGVGIAHEDMERIFEPFFTTKDVGKGTGLGLSQVFGFAKQSGGDVDVESVIGGGATFTVYLPQADTQGSREAKPTEPNISVDGDGRCVLVVEDNIDVGQFATQLLNDLGYRTDWVTSAEEALEKLGPDGDGFDIVFSDVVMPGMGGIELAKRLSHDLPTMPVVLASGYSHVLAERGTEGMELIRKPYSGNQLSMALQRRMAWAAAMSA
jgi:PAS domain S-box-containing protein